MSIQVALHHRTTYSYDRLVALGPQVVRLRPAPHSRTPVLSYSLKVSPAEHFINWQQDPQGNHLARLVFPEKTRKFEVTVDLVADMSVINPFDFFLESSAETWPFAYDASLAEEIAPFRKLEPLGPRLSAWLAKVDRKEQRTIDFVVGLNARLQSEIGYIVRLEPGVQTCEETLARAKGSCRDTGWLLVMILRHLGFAARFAGAGLARGLAAAAVLAADFGAALGTALATELGAELASPPLAAGAASAPSAGGSEGRKACRRSRVIEKPARSSGARARSSRPWMAI